MILRNLPAPLTVLRPLQSARLLRLVSCLSIVEWTRFGQDADIVVNLGEQDFDWRGTLIPKEGFVVSSPTLVAFCASRHADVKYSEPTRFIIWARDGLDIEESKDVRIYHGFGDSTVRCARFGDTLDGKSEIRSKHEIRNKFKFPKCQ